MSATPRPSQPPRTGIKSAANQVGLRQTKARRRWAGDEPDAVGAGARRPPAIAAGDAQNCHSGGIGVLALALSATEAEAVITEPIPADVLAAPPPIPSQPAGGDAAPPVDVIGLEITPADGPAIVAVTETVRSGHVNARLRRNGTLRAGRCSRPRSRRALHDIASEENFRVTRRVGGFLVFDVRGHAGAVAQRTELTERDRRICARVGAHCRNRGLALVGLDVLSDHLTEINVTSPPACARSAAPKARNSRPPSSTGSTRCVTPRAETTHQSMTRQPAAGDAPPSTPAKEP